MTPASLGFRMPPEWAPQTATWLSWPVADPRHWGGTKRILIEAKFAEIASVIGRYQLVRINAPADDHPRIQKICHEAGLAQNQLQLFDHPNDDVWCRDHGPIFVKQRETGEVAVTDWQFNAWGGKFEPWDRDNLIPEHVSKSLKMKRFSSSLVLEGGAIEINSHGQLLTTEAVLLNPNRNPGLDQRSMEQALHENLGASEILWLQSGIEGDDTDGHIDDLARFVNDHTILACSSKDSPNRERLTANWQRLQEFRTIQQRPFDLVEIPLPDPCEIPGWRLPVLPASYVNYLLINGALLAPTFRQATSDNRALGLLRELFPRREVIGIDCLDLVEEGGTLHCLTQQQPE